MIQSLSDYTAPPAAPHVQHVWSLESENGIITLAPNRAGYGYRLRDDAEGYGAAEVENELTPRRGLRGSMLGTQHAEAGDMFLPVMVSSTSGAEVERLVAELIRVLKPAEGVLKIIRENPVTGHAVFREVAYKNGLRTPRWSSPYAVEFGLTFDNMDPWAYAQPKTVNLAPVASSFDGGWIAPFVFPLTAIGTSVPSVVAVTNEGQHPAPVMVTFYGPSNRPRAWSGPYEIEYRGTLAHDEWVAINGKDHTVMLGGGGRAEPIPVPGRLSPHTLLTDLTAPVGTTEWWYEAIDETAQSRATFTWWDPYDSMK